MLASPLPVVLVAMSRDASESALDAFGEGHNEQANGAGAGLDQDNNMDVDAAG